MTITQDVETSVTVNKNSPIQHYVHPDDHTQRAYEMTLGSNFSQYSVLFALKQSHMDLMTFQAID